MSVDLHPSAQLAFSRPLTQLVKKTLVISNGHAEPVAFKVKTTAPKQYCVRPNSGRIEPGEKVEVSVLLQPMKEEPPQGVKCKDKFLVQSAIITSDKEVLSLAEVWSAIEKESRANIHEQKIRCAYVDAGVDQDREVINEADHSVLIDGSPNVLVNGASPVTPTHTQTTFHQADTTLPTQHDSSFTSAPRSITPTNGTTNGLPHTSFSTPVPAAAAAASTPVPTTASTSSSELEKLKDEIRDLKAKLADATNPTSVAGLRKRGGGVEKGGAGAEVAMLGKESVQQGVPLEIVAGLVFATFVMTYFLF